MRRRISRKFDRMHTEKPEELCALLVRIPKKTCPRIDIPTPLYKKIVEWRPVLGRFEPLAALFQVIAFSHARDEDWHTGGDCVGVPLPHALVFACFGMAPQTGHNRDLNAGVLLEFYRRAVDSDFDWSGWHGGKGKARVTKSHGLPDRILRGIKEALLGPGDYEHWTYLISGKSASDRNLTAALRQERRRHVRGTIPVVDPPETTTRIQSYLNELPQQLFGHGSHGIFRPKKIDEALEVVGNGAVDKSAVNESAVNESAVNGSAVGNGDNNESWRDQQRRILFWIRTFPKPLYLPCDRFPRQRADHQNQAMNLPTPVRRSFYTGRDYELDLSKAHLASCVPVARREGMAVPTLKRYLQANLRGDTDLLEGGDLWLDLASYLEVNGPIDKKRKVVKRAYSLVYGKAAGRLWYQLLKEWKRLTGRWVGSTTPFKKLGRHPLIKELLQARSQLRQIIDKRGGLEDVRGRLVPLSAWDATKKKENRWRGVLAYVNASFEQALLYPVFEEALAERRREGPSRFQIWLYQADGVTVRIHRKYDHRPQIKRLQEAVAKQADELGVPTELEVDYSVSDAS